MRHLIDGVIESGWSVPKDYVELIKAKIKELSNQDLYLSDIEVMLLAVHALDKAAKKTLEVKNSDVEFVGDPDCWKLICSASSREGAWAKSTRGFEIPDCGVLIQVSNRHGDRVAKSICFVPDVCLIQYTDDAFWRVVDNTEGVK